MEASPKRNRTKTRKTIGKTARNNDNPEIASVKKTMHWLIVATVVVSLAAALFAYWTLYGSKEHIRAKHRNDKSAVYGVIMPKGYSIHGIDISHHQYYINWDSLETTRFNPVPLTFIFMKATEGDDFVDRQFDTYFDQARKHGFTRGAYHFFSPDSDPVEQAQLFISNVDLTTGDLPPVLDVERAGDEDKEIFAEKVLKWLRYTEKHYGVSPIIYASKKFKDKYLSDSRFSSYPYWIAHYYKESLDYDNAWSFWQHTDIGMVPGIKGDVDMNVFNGNAGDLDMMLIK